MSLGSNQNLYKLQNLLQIKFNNDLTYHGTKSDFNKGFFFKFELDMARFDILLSKILAYSSNTDLQKLQIQETGWSKIAPVKEHLNYNFFGPLSTE